MNKLFEHPFYVRDYFDRAAKQVILTAQHFVISDYELAMQRGPDQIKDILISRMIILKEKVVQAFDKQIDLIKGERDE